MPVAIYVGMDHPGKHVSAGGSYYPPFKEVDESLRNVLDPCEAGYVPIDFLEYFLQGGIGILSDWRRSDEYQRPR